jgi:hypothetical protein
MSFNKKITTKEFYNIELVNISEWYAQSRQEDKEKFNVLPFRVQLALRTNMQEVNKTAQSLIEMRNELTQSLGNKYIEAGKTEEVEVNGSKRIEVKKEFAEEYQADAAECQRKLDEVLEDRTEITLSVFDMESVYDTLPDDCRLNIRDIDMLSFMDKVQKDDEVKEDTVVEGK